MKNSLCHLENVIKKFYISSIGNNDIYYGNKNTKRFVISFVNWIIIWSSLVLFLSLSLSDYLFSQMDISLFSGHLRLLIMLVASFNFMNAIIKMDWIFGEINYNLSPFKVIYYLMMDLKHKHKLNDKNYKKLAILSRITQIMLMDCGTILIVVVTILIFIKLCILSGKFLWISFIFLLTPVMIINLTISTITICFVIIIFAYYKLLFDQINNQINYTLNLINELTLFKRKLTRGDTHRSLTDLNEIWTVNSSYPVARLKWQKFFPISMSSWSKWPSKFDHFPYKINGSQRSAFDLLFHCYVMQITLNYIIQMFIILLTLLTLY